MAARSASASWTRGRGRAATSSRERVSGAGNAAATLPRVPVFEHDYGVPDEDELAQLVGAATPHFSHQILGRVAGFARTLPPDHPRQPELQRHIAHLEAIGGGGETGGIPRSDLPPRPALSRLGAPVDGDSGPPIPHN